MPTLWARSMQPGAQALEFFYVGLHSGKMKARRKVPGQYNSYNHCPYARPALWESPGQSQTSSAPNWEFKVCQFEIATDQIWGENIKSMQQYKHTNVCPLIVTYGLSTCKCPKGTGAAQNLSRTRTLLDSNSYHQTHWARCLYSPIKKQQVYELS